jgi:CPA2 family monovalent cation:H+ antiporter-2
MDITLLIDLGIIIVAATLFGYVARVFKQPSLLAYILAGVVVGPLVLGRMDPINGFKIGISSMEDIRILSELGIAFLLFSVGVETDFRKFLSTSRIAILGGCLQVALTIGIVMLFSMLFPIISFEQSVYLGVILAFSSTMVVIKLLGDNYQINTLHGRLMIGFLLVQDFLVILAIPLLKDITVAFAPSTLGLVLVKIAVLIVSAAIINRHLFPRLFRFSMNYQEEFYLAALSSCFIFIGLAILMQLPLAVGAFIGGLALSTLPYNTEIYNKIRGIRDFFVIIFFTSLGMQLTISFAAIPIALIVFIIALVLIIKPLMYYLITIFSGYGNKVAIMVGLGLANVSEFSLILAQLGFNPVNPAQSILTEGQFSLIILAITISMVLTPYMMQSYAEINKAFEKAGKKLPSKFKRKMFSAKLAHLDSIPKKLKDHIIIVGGGTMGLNMAEALYKHNPLVVMDQDSEVVFSCIRKGINAYYGESQEEGDLEKANPRGAKLVVVAIPNSKATLRALQVTKKANKKTPVFARAHYYRDALKLYKEGADYVCMPYVIGGNEFLKNVAKFLETGNVSSVRNLQAEYLHYLKEKAKQEKEHFGF